MMQCHHLMEPILTFHLRTNGLTWVQISSPDFLSNSLIWGPLLLCSRLLHHSTLTHLSIIPNHIFPGAMHSPQCRSLDILILMQCLNFPSLLLCRYISTKHSSYLLGIFIHRVICLHRFSALRILNSPNLLSHLKAR